jgi:predicted dehydrogenase
VVASGHNAKTLNIGMLGHGFMGRVHSHAYATIPHIFPDLTCAPRLNTVSGMQQDQPEQFARQFGYERWTNDWRAVVDDPEIDIIDVCLPEYLHEEVCLAALEARKHVFCEKPLALSAASARGLVIKAAETPVKAMCGFNYRFLPAVRLARELIYQGVLGALYLIRASYCQESGHDPDRPAEQVRYAYGKTQLGSIRGLGSHLIDMARFMGGDASSVTGLMRTFVGARKMSDGQSYQVKADDMATLQVEFNSGAIGILTATAVATGRKNQLSLEVNGSKGSLSYDLETPNHLQVYLDDATHPELRGFSNVNVTERPHPLMKYWWPPAHNLGWEHGHINELKHFLDCVSADQSIGPYGATFEDGLRAAEWAEQAWISSRDGRRISLAGG